MHRANLHDGVSRVEEDLACRNEEELIDHHLADHRSHSL